MNLTDIKKIWDQFRKAVPFWSILDFSEKKAINIFVESNAKILHMLQANVCSQDRLSNNYIMSRES